MNNAITFAMLLFFSFTFLTSGCCDPPASDTVVQKAPESPKVQVIDKNTHAKAPKSTGITAKAPAKALKALDEKGDMQISDEDRCPVCAMKVKDHSKFASGIEMDDHSMYHFCGTGCMIRSWMHPELFLGSTKEQLHKPIVKEYMGGTTIDARSAVWVAGSDIVGPMGPALVPLKNDEDAATFIKRHGSKTTFKLDELTDEKWKAITGKNVTP